MSTELQKAIESFCLLIPESKIGEYSSNSNDDRRLKHILDTALKNKEDVSPKHIIETLSACHPEIDMADIIKCADTAFHHMFNI